MRAATTTADAATTRTVQHAAQRVMKDDYSLMVDLIKKSPRRAIVNLRIE